MKKMLLVNNKTQTKWKIRKSTKRKPNRRRTTKTKVLKGKLRKKGFINMKNKDRN
jgi:hypothetical protein